MENYYGSNNITIINEYNPIKNYQKKINKDQKQENDNITKNKIKDIKKYINLTTKYPIFYFLFGFLFVIITLALLMLIMHNDQSENNPLKNGYNYFFCSKIL